MNFRYVQKISYEVRLAFRASWYLLQYREVEEIETFVGAVRQVELFASLFRV